MAEQETSDKGKRGQWVKIPLPEVPRDGLAWHYTGVEGLLGIVSNHSVWASSPRVLNDLSELQYGAEVLKEAWLEIRNGSKVPDPCMQFVESVLFSEDFLPYMMENSFILSTSLSGDLLSQWMHYSKSDGFAIGIDLSVQLWPKGATKVEQGTQVEQRSGLLINGWAKIIYDRPTQLKVCTELLLTMVQITPGTPDTWESEIERWPSLGAPWRFLLGRTLLQLKHPAFCDEREVRYICARDRESVTKFRASSGRLIPYLEIARHPYPFDSKQTQPEGVPEPRTLPIKKIMCGPDVRPGTPELVKSLLVSYGYEDVEVDTSDIPYSGV